MEKSGHCYFVQPNQYTNNPKELSSWQIADKIVYCEQYKIKNLNNWQKQFIDW